MFEHNIGVLTFLRTFQKLVQRVAAVMGLDISAAVAAFHRTVTGGFLGSSKGAYCSCECSVLVLCVYSLGGRTGGVGEEDKDVRDVMGVQSRPFTDHQQETVPGWVNPSPGWSHLPGWCPVGSDQPGPGMTST